MNRPRNRRFKCRRFAALDAGPADAGPLNRPFATTDDATNDAYTPARSRSPRPRDNQSSDPRPPPLAWRQRIHRPPLNLLPIPQTNPADVSNRNGLRQTGEENPAPIRLPRLLHQTSSKLPAISRVHRRRGRRTTRKPKPSHAPTPPISTAFVNELAMLHQQLESAAASGGAASGPSPARSSLSRRAA